MLLKAVLGLHVTPESPDSLIKYCGTAAAEHILTSGALRWSSPENFGDPFELSTKIELNFDEKSLLDTTVKLTSSMLFSSECPQGDSPIISVIKRWRDEDRFSTPDEAHDVLREQLHKMVSYRLEQLEESLHQWREYIKNLRICCFCEKPDSIPSWEKYADRHQGIALRFALNPGSTIAGAIPITYNAEPLQLTNLREQLGAVLHNKKDGILTRFKDQYLNKGMHHKPEKEWRCFRTTVKPVATDADKPADWIDDIAFSAHELTAVYFGINISNDTKKRLSQLVKTNYKTAKLFQIVRGKTGYTLDVEKL